MRPLAWEHPYVVGVARKEEWEGGREEGRKEGEKRNSFFKKVVQWYGNGFLPLFSQPRGNRLEAIP